MQLFSDLDPIAVVNQSIKLSNSRTPLLVDGDFTTCISRLSFTLQSSAWARVIPDEFYIRRNIFSIHLAGKGFTCSPVGGITVSLQPPCPDKTHCIGALPCIAGKAAYKDSLIVCGYRCTSQLYWEFVVVYLRSLLYNHGGSLPELCEIWFSIWWQGPL